jgi:hypothetical protein
VAVRFWGVSVTDFENSSRQRINAPPSAPASGDAAVQSQAMTP